MKIMLELEVTSEEISEEHFRPAQIHHGLFNELTDMTIEVNGHTYTLRPKRMITEDGGGQWVSSR